MDHPAAFIPPRQHCRLCGHTDTSGDQHPFAVEHGVGLCVLEAQNSREDRTVHTPHTFRTLTEKLGTDGGFSVDREGNVPTTGYMVSLAGYEKKLPVVNVLHLVQYYRRHLDVLDTPDVYFGGWVDNGAVYLDVSVNIQDLSEAVMLGRTERQLAIYDVEADEEIHLALGGGVL